MGPAPVVQEPCGPLSWVVLCCAHRQVMAGYLNPAIGRVGQSSVRVSASCV